MKSTDYFLPTFDLDVALKLRQVAFTSLPNIVYVTSCSTCFDNSKISALSHKSCFYFYSKSIFRLEGEIPKLSLCVSKVNLRDLLEVMKGLGGDDNNKEVQQLPKEQPKALPSSSPSPVSSPMSASRRSISTGTWNFPLWNSLF